MFLAASTARTTLSGKALFCQSKRLAHECRRAGQRTHAWVLREMLQGIERYRANGERW